MGVTVTSNNSQQVSPPPPLPFPPKMDNQYYGNQQQILYLDNQFGVPRSTNGEYYSGYYGRQQQDALPGYPVNQPGGYYGEPQAISGNFYNLHDGDSASINYGYYGGGQQAFDHGGYQHTELANSLNINSGYYGAQEQSESKYSEIFEMQKDFDRYTTAERPAVGGMTDRYNGEFSSPYCIGNTNSMQNHSGTILPEKQVPVEQQFIAHQTNDSSSTFRDDHRRPTGSDTALVYYPSCLNTNSAPVSSPADPLDSSSFFNSHFNHQQNSSSVTASGPIYPQGTNSVPISSLGHFQDRNSATAFGLGHLMNGNHEFANCPHSLRDRGSNLVVDLGRSINTNPTSTNDPGNVANTSPIGSQNNNPALTHVSLQLENGNPAIAGGPGRLVNINRIPISSRGHPQDSSPKFMNNLATPTNSNGALIKFLGPKSYLPRWCNETIGTSVMPPAPSTPPKELVFRRHEDEENDLKNPLSNPFLESLLSGSTSFENLARVDGISRTDLKIADTPHCPHILKGRCQNASMLESCCSDKIHFKRMIYTHTDVRLGDCSFLDSCDMVEKCPYVHYVAEFPENVKSLLDMLVGGVGDALGEEIIGVGRLADDVGPTRTKHKAKLALTDIQHPPNASSPPQWIKCDVRQLDLKTLGKFGVVMADPPWDIRMTLPYGTVPDQAIIDLPFKGLQDEGVFFLWCTARAVDTGRACLKAWGYKFSDEIAWVKADHLKRLISVGRTGHWLNHTMEHCLIGIKGNPKWIRRGCDTDVIVSQPRATSHKPDEIYELVERLVGPHTRKLEVFGRDHNIRKGWLTIGNQLTSTYLHEENLKKALVKELSHNSSIRCYYNPDWDPWTEGFTRFGCGEKGDWREERKLYAKQGSRGKPNKEIRGGGNGHDGSHAKTTVDIHSRSEKECETGAEYI